MGNTESLFYPDNSNRRASAEELASDCTYYKDAYEKRKGEIERELGGEGKVRAILRMRDLMRWLEDNGRVRELESMQKYWEEYGVKD